MITGEIKNKVDKIWEIFWTGGITNPLSVIEQITYLLFIKSLDDKQSDSEANASLLGTEVDKIFPDNQSELRWKNFKQMDAVTMFETMQKKVFPFIKNMDSNKQSAFSKYMADAIYMIPTPQMLEKIITNVDTLPLKERDTKGDLYEYLLSKVATAGTNGQFRTPRHIIKMMVELMKPTPTDIIIDPAAGSAGFLVAAGEYLVRNNDDLFSIQQVKDHYGKDMFHGYDMDSTMLRIGAMNMMLHGVESPNIEYRDSLSEVNKDNEKFTLVLANPPFKGSLDHEAVSADLLKVTQTKKTELLFLSLFLRILKKGGRAASIVPDGVLFGSSGAHKAIRKEIVENHQLHAIISMPSGVFKPYAGVSTAIMIFTKTGAGGTDKVWFYDMKADGLSLDDKRQPIEENDIPDIVSRYHNLDSEESRKRTEQSFFVPKDEIVGNDYDLSINRYKEIEYDEVEYEEPFKILEKIINTEKEITNLLSELKSAIV
ncbi:MAG: SAM-dependent DNA methyltransferase [Spirochaetales bacterium]|nr:SAM-dependent DNA methyltransferase [Calditrichota bacterium]MBN2657179.1 SAM-dependent DNA methyltransferase [Spirochaetales bacterium]